MKQTIFTLSLVVVCATLISACNSSTGYNGTPSADPNISGLPTNGMVLTYHYDGEQQLDEHVTLNVLSSKFEAIRVSDTLNGFFTSKINTFGVLSNGDLYVTGGCDTFPTWSHHSYGGDVYVGKETIMVGAGSFDCDLMRSTKTAIVQDSVGNVDTATMEYNYWYSPKLRYFVKESLNVRSFSSAIYTRALVSYH